MPSGPNAGEPETVRSATEARDGAAAARRIAMWSGPRNISTAMMRAWENRPDTVVCDEPLYAHYLLHTGNDHPGRREVIAACETDWRAVVAALVGPVPRRPGRRFVDEADFAADDARAGEAGIYYQKHMSHHLLPHIERGWLAQLTHAFLIREPREMLTSLIRNLTCPRLEDTGLPQQVELVRYVEEQAGRPPPIVDARDVLEDPRRMLTLLCEALDVPFSEAMLSWPPGRRTSDGVWAPHWYAAVERSTGFEPYRPKPEQLPPTFRGLLDECERCYGWLYARRLH